MFATSFYHSSIRKYVIAFGNLFNDILVVRTDVEGTEVQKIAVPIAYGPKEKFLVRMKQDPNLDKEVAITLPRIGFNITDFTYASTRKLSSTLKNIQIKNDDFDKMKSQFVPVPYDIGFQLSIFVKNADDGCQIIEQILPYFRPEFTANVKLIPEMDITVPTHILLESVEMEDTYEGNFEERRALVYNLQFRLKGYFYGPVSASGIIKRAKTNFYNLDPLGQTQEVTIEPAQDAEGNPLFSPPDDSGLSVATSEISAESDYGFSTSYDKFN